MQCQHKMYSFKRIPFSVAFVSGMCFPLTHSSENGGFRKSSKPSTAKRRRSCPILSRDLRFVSKLPAYNSLSSLWSSNLKVANYFVCGFRPIKPVRFQDSRIFRIHILLNFEILFLEAYRFQNSEGSAGLKEYAHTVTKECRCLSCFKTFLARN